MCSQKPAAGSTSVSYESSTHPPILFKTHLLSSFPKRSLLFGCSNALLSSSLHTYTPKGNIPHTIKRGKKANKIGHILGRNCVLKHIIEEKIEGRIGVTGRRGRRRKQLPEDLKERRGYWKLKGEALDCTGCRAA